MMIVLVLLGLFYNVIIYLLIDRAQKKEKHTIEKYEYRLANNHITHNINSFYRTLLDEDLFSERRL